MIKNKKNQNNIDQIRNRTGNNKKKSKLIQIQTNKICFAFNNKLNKLI